MKQTIKVILAIFLLLCLFSMPYGFYQLVRFIALVGFVILSYFASEYENKTEMIIYISLAILFQPFFKVSLGRIIWNFMDIVVAVGLIITIFIKHENVKINK